MTDKPSYGVSESRQNMVCLWPTQKCLVPGGTEGGGGPGPRGWLSRKVGAVLGVESLALAKNMRATTHLLNHDYYLTIGSHVDQHGHRKLRMPR